MARIVLVLFLACVTLALYDLALVMAGLGH